MTGAKTRTFRVSFDTWVCHDRYIEADSEADAIAKAEALYERHGLAAFGPCNRGKDDFEAEPAPDAVVDGN